MRPPAPPFMSRVRLLQGQRRNAGKGQRSAQAAAVGGTRKSGMYPAMPYSHQGGARGEVSARRNLLLDLESEPSISPQHSEVKGKAVPSALPAQPLWRYHSAQARRVGDRPALRVVHQDIEWTYRELKKKVDSVASSWLDLGLLPGKCVVSLQPLQAELYLAHAAAARLATIFVPLNPHLITPDELTLALDRYQANLVIAGEKVYGAAKDGKAKNRNLFELIQQVIPDVAQVQGESFIRSPRFPAVRAIYLTGVTKSEYEGQKPPLLANAWGPYGYFESRLSRIAPVQTAEQALLCLPDGPVQERAIVYTHRNSMTAGVGAARITGLTEEDRVAVCPSDYLRPAASVLAQQGCLAAGACLVFAGEGEGGAAREMTAFMSALATEGCTGTFVSSATALALLTGGSPGKAGGGEGKKKKDKKKKGGEEAEKKEKEAEKKGGDVEAAAAKESAPSLSLRFAVVCVDATSKEQLTRAQLSELRKLFGAKVLHVLRGPLEAPMLFHSTVTEEGHSEMEATENLELRIVGDDGGPQAKTLGRGQLGALRLRGAAVADRYWNNAGQLHHFPDVLGFVTTPHDASYALDGRFECIRA
eukprot:Hpha_TRINITY_DN14925_c2_g1::TRINITY_DN14925_c2_g1_i1::g.145056::m.145056/K00666/K00666; fatty-acyl-CoA synthase